MKIFHLSDLHIGLKLYNRSLQEDQKHVFRQIANYVRSEKPDAILISGDIYDRADPAADAVELFDEFVNSLKAAYPETEIMMISGNHDSQARINVFRNVLKGQKLHMIGIPPQREDEFIEKITKRDEFGAVNFYLLPFVKPSSVKLITGTKDDGRNLSYDEAVHMLIEREQINDKERNVLVSHQFYLPKGMNSSDIERSDSEIRTVGNIDEVSADVLEVFDYAALGHIHKAMKVGNEKYRYCGTPMQYSISEAGQDKGIVMVELKEKGDVKTSVLKLEPLRQLRLIKGKLSEVLKMGCEDFVSVLLTDKTDLDVLDMQDRLRMAFPYLLEIRREGVSSYDVQRDIVVEKELDPFELCCSFLGEVSDEEKDIITEIINKLNGGEN